MTDVEGIDELVEDLAALVEDLGSLGDDLADVAVETARNHNTTRSYIAGGPVVTGSRALVSYAGAIYPAGFTRAVVDELGPRVVEAIEDEITNTIEKRDLQP